MASGVFGIPISLATVIATGEYREPITQKDVADYAMKMINAGSKDIEAQKFVESLRERYGKGISAKCLIYNATGATLDFVTYKDWYGHTYDAPHPSSIQNGQWGAFVHVQGFMSGSTGAVVYRSTGVCDWLFCWSLPLIGNNGVYTEIREEGHYPPYWKYIYSKRLGNSNRSSTDIGYDNGGYVSQTEIGQGDTVSVRAVFHLPYKKVE